MSKLGAPLLEFDSLPSTNELAKEMAASGAPEGTTILAREQTLGRGRLGRSWASAAGQGLYMSVILRPAVEARRFAVMTLAAAVSVAETLEGSFAIPADIKWPNDVMVSERKVCGILLETASEGQNLEYAVLGIGVNLSQREFPDELRNSATSLFLESGRLIEPREFLWPLLDRLQYWYQVSTDGPGPVLARWEQMSSYARGCAVRVTSVAKEFVGLTGGLSESGALIVQLVSGERIDLVSGEVSLRKLQVSDGA